MVTRRENGTHFYIIDGGEYRGEANDGVFVYNAGDSFRECALLLDKPQTNVMSIAQVAVVVGALCRVPCALKPIKLHTHWNATGIPAANFQKKHNCSFKMLQFRGGPKQ